LILTRDTRNNTIRIGDDIEIKVVEIRGGQVRIGIEAQMTGRFCGKSWWSNTLTDSAKLGRFSSLARFMLPLFQS